MAISQGLDFRDFTDSAEDFGLALKLLAAWVITRGGEFFCCLDLVMTHFYSASHLACDNGHISVGLPAFLGFLEGVEIFEKDLCP